MPAWFCDAEPSGKDHFMLSLFDKNCSGPILFVGPCVEQKETAIRRIDVSQMCEEKVLHPCLWPLTVSEFAGKPFAIKENLGPLAFSFISDEIWKELWKTKISAFFFSPCKSDENVANLEQTVVLNGCYNDGAFVRREKIPNPSLPFNSYNPCIDTVALSILVVFRGKQRQRAIVHFSKTGYIQRCQINCYNYGCEEDSGAWVAEYVRTIKNTFPLEELKL